MEVKDQSSGKGGRTQIVQGPLQALFSHAPPSYSKANLGITYTESLFAGYPPQDCTIFHIYMYLFISTENAEYVNSHLDHNAVEMLTCDQVSKYRERVYDRRL